jgi:hypothetical protein
MFRFLLHGEDVMTTPKPNAKRIPPVLWFALGELGILALAGLVFLTGGGNFFTGLLFGCFAALFSASLAVLGIGGAIFASSRRNRLAYFAAAAVATSVLIVMLWGAGELFSRPILRDVERMQAAPLGDLQAWAVGLLNSPAAATQPGVGLPPVPPNLQSSIGQSWVDVEPNASPSGPPHVEVIRGGGLSEMHYGWLVGQPDYVPMPVKGHYAVKWADGVYFVTDFKVEGLNPEFPLRIAGIAGGVLVIALVVACRGRKGAIQNITPRP